MSNLSNYTLNEIDPSEIYKRMQKTCLRKCVMDLSKVQLDPAEESCLHRCSIKYREALVFGIDMLRYQEKEVKDITEQANKAAAEKLLQKNPFKFNQ